MSITIDLKNASEFTDLVISPLLAPETVSLQTPGKETGDIRMLGAKALLSLGSQHKLSAEMIRRAGGSLAKWLKDNNITSAGVELYTLVVT